MNAFPCMPSHACAIALVLTFEEERVSEARSRARFASFAPVRGPLPAGRTALVCRRASATAVRRNSSSGMEIERISPPRPRSILLGLAVWTDDATLIGNLIMEPGDWVKALHIETVETPRDLEWLSAPPQPVRPLAEDQGMKDGSTLLPKSDNGPPA